MDVFDQAARFALDAHKGMTRKRENIPFMLHPMEVASIAGTMTGDHEVIAAALLHDTVEDTDTVPADLAAQFSPRVCALVASETEDKHPELPPSASWRMRKEESLRELTEADDQGVAILWLADKLSNMRSFARLHRKEGMGLWQHFHQTDPAEQQWYYQTVADLTRSLSHTAAWQEYVALLSEVFELEEPYE